MPLARSFAILSFTILGFLASTAATRPRAAAGSIQPERQRPATAPTRFGSLFLESGEGFRATDREVQTYSCALRVRLQGRYRFTLEVDGAVAALTLGTPQPVLELHAAGGPGGTTRATSGWVELERGSIALAVDVERRGDGQLRLRTLWERENDELGGFPAEPIPARAVEDAVIGPLADPTAGFGDEESRMRLARGLEELRCAACHAEDAGVSESYRTAPNLDRVGARFGADWLRRWLRDPHAVKPGTAMPRMFATGDADVEALVQFLSSDGSEAAVEAEPLATEEAVLSDGRRLYHRVGCVACHGALESPAAVAGDEFLQREVAAVGVPAPLGDMQGKWRPSSLSAFLRDPHATRSDGSMPSLGLSSDESDRLATYLLQHWGAAEAPLAVDPNLVARGAKVFRERSCASCHPSESRVAPAPIGGWTSEASARAHGSGGSIDYQDDSLERLLVEAFSERTLPSRTALLGAEGLDIDFLRHTVGRLNCLACHELDGVGGPPAALDPYFANTDERVDLGDEGRYAPDLSGIGWKLNTSWLQSVLVDGGRARPYMDLRMPQYGEAHVGALAQAFAKREGLRPGSDLDVAPPTDEAVVVGRQLMGHEWFNCMACHVHTDFPPSGSPGPAITQFGERLRYEWFSRYMRNPQRFKPGSRMPDFGTGARSSLRTILDGDYAAQIDAMWAYFLLGEEMPPPEGLERGVGLQLTVGDRPMVHRAFLPDVGARGIAVGLPIGAHYAFDAATSRVVHAWRGDFLDASGSWAGRGGNTDGGQGETFWRARDEHALRLFLGGLEDSAADWSFRGYRLDESGSPTFLYAGGHVSVEERFTLTLLPEPRIRRSFTIDGLRGADTLQVDVEDSVENWRASDDGVPPIPPATSPVQFIGQLTDQPLTISWEVKP